MNGCNLSLLYALQIYPIRHTRVAMSVVLNLVRNKVHVREIDLSFLKCSVAEEEYDSYSSFQNKRIDLVGRHLAAH